MKYKGIKLIEATGKWLRVDGTEYPKCSVCGHLQDIWKDGGTHCTKCGSWMQDRYIINLKDDGSGID